MNSIILKTATRLVSALVLVLSIYLLWRGHHATGGGFIAALVAATGFALVVLSEGPGVVRRGLRIRPQYLIGAGMGLSMGAGLVGYDAPAAIFNRYLVAIDKRHRGHTASLRHGCFSGGAGGHIDRFTGPGGELIWNRHWPSSAEVWLPAVSICCSARTWFACFSG